jgi:2-methylcitrate dehydratase PrpD
MDVTAKISEFVTEIQFDQIPLEALETAKVALLDSLGVALAGSREAGARICAEIVRQEQARQDAVVIGQGFKSSASQAAFVNGTAVHALDYDYSISRGGQPAAAIVPAIFAVGEPLGAGGRQLLEAYVAGFEVTAKIAASLVDSSEDGWHAPGILGSFGASVACAKLLGLDATQVRMALGVAVSMASGVICNFGTMTKPLHAGLGARNGVLAAKMAAAGYTANAQAIEGGMGFYDVFYRGSPIDFEPLQELGASYDLVTHGIKIKPYPCDGLTHPAIDATLSLREEHSLSAESIESIDVDVTAQTYSRVPFHIPETGVQGKFSMAYHLARAITDGKITLDVFTDAAVRDENVLQLTERIRMRVDPGLKARDRGSRPCRVTVHMKDGQTYTRYGAHAKGSRELPLTADELKGKFFECARRAIDQHAAERVLEAIDRFETLEDIRPLCNVLMGS